MTLKEQLQASAIIEEVSSLCEKARTERDIIAGMGLLRGAASILDSEECKLVPADQMEHLILLYAEASIKVMGVGA